MGLVALCGIDAVDEEIPVRVELDGVDYAVFTRSGAYYVTRDLCTHGPGLMSEGYLEGEEVECPFHQGRFNFITGAPTLAPCTEPLRTWTVHVVDGQVCIDPSEIRNPA
jgi:nitrite reductase/ring-hydroxylating ferredoxin subunit